MSSIAAAQPWLIEVPVEEPKKKGLWEEFQEFHALSKEVGGLVQPSIAASLLDVSRARIYDMMKNGRFTVHDFMEQKFLEMREVKAYYASERKAGRPRTSFKAQIKRAISVGEEIGEEVFQKE